MKKKAIEKIPYICPKRVMKKNCEYIGVTAVENVGGKDHLIVEVYRNQKKALKCPVKRIVVTDSEYMTYTPEDDGWSSKIMPDEDRTKLQSPADFENIKKICSVKIYDKSRWWEYIQEHERKISLKKNRRAAARKLEKRAKALDERIKNTAALPEEMILREANRRLFMNKHYLYYRKRGSRVQIACSKCGGVANAKCKAGISYESQFEKIINPVENEYGICPLCKTRGIYKCQGKNSKPHREKKYLFLGQKYKEKGVVMRYVLVEKKWILEEIEGKKKPEMHGAYEEIEGVEIARAYFEENENLQIDYHKCGYEGDFWDDCNLAGMSNIEIKPAAVFEESYEEIKGTILQYSALKEYTLKAGKVNAIDYLERYRRFPQIEILTKMGLTGVVENLVNYRCGIIADSKARTPEKFLGIRKERLPLLIKEKGNIGLLDTMKTEKRLGLNLSDGQLQKLDESGLQQWQVELALKYMTIQKLLNRIEKYAGCKFHGCAASAARIRQVAREYIDYLSMREQLGYDLNNLIYQYPRNLEGAHEAMVTESNAKEQDKRMLEVEINFPNIRSMYRRLKKKYYYEDDNYFIRPARSAAEIVREGRTLHHCVGGNDYLSKHSGEFSYILMLRKKKTPQMPYITVEISGQTGEILQWHGAYNEKPDKEMMSKWLENYVKMLKDNQLKTA